MFGHFHCTFNLGSLKNRSATMAMAIGEYHFKVKFRKIILHRNDCVALAQSKGTVAKFRTSQWEYGKLLNGMDIS